MKWDSSPKGKGNVHRDRNLKYTQLIYTEEKV